MSHVITPAAQSSTDAFGYALRQIQAGVLPMILTGGVDAPIAPGIMKGFTLMKIMTRHGTMNLTAHRGRSRKTATDSWSPRVRGCLSWKITDRAKARGAKIYAEIAGYGSTCEAFHRVRLGRMRRRTGARHRNRHEGSWNLRHVTCNTLISTALRLNSTTVSRRAP